MKACRKCGEEWTRKEQPGFKATCPKCTTYLHSCRNCRLYNPSADRCSSVTAECAGDRESLNYCEEFMFRDTPSNANGKVRNGHAAATVLGLEARAPRTDSGSAEQRRIPGRDKFNQLFNP